MMNSKIILLSCILSMSVLQLLAQDEETKANKNTSYELKVQLEKLRNSKGVVEVKLLDEHEELIEKTRVKVNNKSAEVVFKGVIPNQYTLLYYHDENENKEMDKNFVGMPIEGYGFSNNAEGRFGPPKLEERLFKVSSDTTVLLYPLYH